MAKMIVADTVFTNAKVLTMDDQNTICESLAVSGSRILAAGTYRETEEYIGPSTQVIDAGGHTLMPGFNDAHLHFLMYGMLGDNVINVDYTNVDSIADIQALIREQAAHKKAGEWIKLSGYDHNKLAERRHPTRQELDEAAPDNPVQCARICAHMGVYNSLALSIGNLTDASGYDPGQVVVDELGVPTGLLKETAHMNMSQLVEYSDEEILNGLKRANDYCLSHGITSVTDAGSYGAKPARLMQKAAHDGTVKVRINTMLFTMLGKESNIAFIEDHLRAGIPTGTGDAHYRIGPAKIMTDGSSSGPSSATREPYSHDPELPGLLVWERDEIADIAAKLKEAGLQMTAHAVGDKAISYLVSAYEETLQGDDTRRWRIEHCALVDPDLIGRIKALGVVPCSNPAFVTVNAGDYLRFYGDRVHYMFPLRSYLDAGVVTCIGSDAPITDPNPVFGLHGALLRSDIKTGEVCGENQTIGIMDILRMYTRNGAYASFEENEKGSLEPGKLADLIILSDDILAVPPERIMDVTVDLTMVGGNIAYTKNV